MKKTCRNKVFKLLFYSKEFFLALIVAFLFCVPTLYAKSEYGELLSVNNIAQQEIIKGKVVDIDGVPLIGVSVSVKDTKQGSVTDMDGVFSQRASIGQTLIISYIGYTTKEVLVKDYSSLNITLEDDDITLETVVVTALGIKREQKALSYNVQEVKGDELLGVKDANLINSLSGKVAGLTINSGATGIGGATRVVLRGSKSITKDNNALYVIDGIPIFNSNTGGLEQNNEYADQPGGEGISDLNPEDIESMSVLTGPAAAALYGSNAANGAIIITTKKGQAGKPKIIVSQQSTFSKPFILPKFQNKYGNDKGVFNSWGEEQDKYSYDPGDFFSTGSTHITNVSLSVGNQQNQTYASVGGTWGNGIIENNDYNKYNITLRNTTSFLNDKMTLDFGLSYVKQSDKNMLSSGQYNNPLLAVYLYPRGEDYSNLKEYEKWSDVTQLNEQVWPWGSQNLSLQNPYWVLNRNVRTNKKDRYMANISLSYDVLDWLNLVGRARLDNFNNLSEMKNYATTPLLHAPEFGRYKYVQDVNKQVYADFLVNIDKYFGDYSLSANIGTSISDMRNTGRGVDGGLMIPNFFAATNIDKSDPKMEIIHHGWHQQTQSIFANIQLGWKNMIYMTLTGRNDWDSALAKTSKTSFFYPSIGLSGVISEMVRLPKEISYLQVRGSFSSVGSAIPRHLSIPSYTFDSQSGTWYTNTYRAADNLKPERTGSWELGLSSKFWGNKLTFDLTWYKSNTKNQTFNPEARTASGKSSIYIQTGNVENTGWEMALGSNLRKGDFSWSGSFTASTNKNKIKEMLSEGVVFNADGTSIKLEDMGQGGIGSAEYRLRTGGTMGDLYIKKQLKRNEDGSIYLTEKTDKDPGGYPVLESLDSDDYIKVGSVLPKWNLGFRNDFRWKDITLGLMVSARFGGVVVSPTEAMLDGFGVSKRTMKARDNGGVSAGNGTMIDTEKYYTVTGGVEGLMSEYVYSADNVRLQELSVGYYLPSKWVNDIAKIHVAFVGKNLWMIHKKAPFDPEVTASTGTYFQGIDYFMQPSLRNIGFSLRFEF